LLTRYAESFSAGQVRKKHLFMSYDRPEACAVRAMTMPAVFALLPGAMFIRTWFGLAPDACAICKPALQARM
jgi:hypothetical protein